jgi:hypothetical protein
MPNFIEAGCFHRQLGGVKIGDGLSCKTHIGRVACGLLRIDLTLGTFTLQLLVERAGRCRGFILRHRSGRYRQTR